MCGDKSEAKITNAILDYQLFHHKKEVVFHILTLFEYEPCLEIRELA